MKCFKCGKENDDNNKYCSNCGIELEQSIDNFIVNENLKSQTHNDKKSIPILSWISLGFLGIQLFCFLCLFNDFLYNNIYRKLLFVFELPYILVSFILAIISRIKNKDKVSLLLIIVDIVVIVGVVVFLVIVAIALKNLVNSISNPNSEFNNYFSKIINGIRGATE